MTHLLQLGLLKFLEPLQTVLAAGDQTFNTGVFTHRGISDVNLTAGMGEKKREGEGGRKEGEDRQTDRI